VNLVVELKQVNSCLIKQQVCQRNDNRECLLPEHIWTYSGNGRSCQSIECFERFAKCNQLSTLKINTF